MSPCAVKLVDIMFQFSLLENIWNIPYFFSPLQVFSIQEGKEVQEGASLKHLIIVTPAISVGYKGDAAL